jgi:hypothetical protein
MFDRDLSRHLTRALAFSISIAMLCMIFSTTTSAQPWNKKTTVTFTAPIEIPGVGAQVLPAGTYVFRLLDSLSDRNIVQIFNQDESHLYATILAIPNYRLKATDKTVMAFGERAVGEPQAVRAWFYPGDNWGQEFVYPKTRAVELAKITNQPIIYIPDAVAPEIIAPVTTVNEAPVIALEEAPLRAIQPTGKETAVIEVAVPPPMREATLPKTASSLPLLVLIGLLSLSVGSLLRALCVR